MQHSCPRGGFFDLPVALGKGPSGLKCRCNHVGSVVVTIDSRMTPTSTTSTPNAKCIVVRRAMTARGDTIKTVRATGTTALILGSLHPGWTGHSLTAELSIPHRSSVGERRMVQFFSPSVTACRRGHRIPQIGRAHV